jgi:RND family efflux transporter MFP subunit
MTQAAPPDLSKLHRPRRGPGRSRRRHRLQWWGSIALVVAAAGVWFALQPRAVAVQTTSVVTTYPSQQFVLLNSTGYVVAQRKAAISSKATGRLEWLGVAEGSRVKAGDIIARIDARDVVAQGESAQANVRAAKAALEQALAEERDAVAQLKRNQDLLAKGFVSASAVDTAKARAEKATAGVGNARATIGASEATARNAQVSVDYTVIRAPFDGVILSKSANVGDLVTPFSNATDSKGAVVTMADMSTLEVEADVAESSLSKVAPGQPAEIVLDALPTRDSAAASAASCRRSTARSRRRTRVSSTYRSRVLPEMSAKVSFLRRT